MWNKSLEAFVFNMIISLCDNDKLAVALLMLAS